MFNYKLIKETIEEVLLEYEEAILGDDYLDLNESFEIACYLYKERGRDEYEDHFYTYAALMDDDLEEFKECITTEVILYNSEMLFWLAVYYEKQEFIEFLIRHPDTRGDCEFELHAGRELICLNNYKMFELYLQYGLSFKDTFFKDISSSRNPDMLDLVFKYDTYETPMFEFMTNNNFDYMFYLESWRTPSLFQKLYEIYMEHSTVIDFTQLCKKWSIDYRKYIKL